MKRIKKFKIKKIKTLPSTRTLFFALQKIRKRDGRIVKFDQEKITQAIHKAIQSAIGGDGNEAKKLSDKVVTILEYQFHHKAIPQVEEIQDIVEKVLIKAGLVDVAKAYILYRKQRAEIREMKKLIDSETLVEKYLDQSDWRVHENANIDYSLQGLNLHIFTAIISQYWLNKIFSERIKKAHLEADFHIHDLYMLACYCSGWDLKDLLLKGFGGVKSKIQSAPPRHFRSALGQVVNFFYTITGETAGAVAFSNLDTYLAPFIRYDKLNYKKTKQALQEFIFNINIPTRVGFQTPFTNVTLDLKVPEMMKDEPVVADGKLQKEKYGDFQKEMDMFNQAFAEVMLEGDAKGRVFTFPIPTINITKDFDWENSVIDKIFEMSAKYGIPYFSNFINSDIRPEDTRSMCLHSKEKIIVKDKEKIRKLTIEELVEKNAQNFDNLGWSDCNKNLKVLSLNPQTYQIEWQKIISFLKKKDKTIIQITTRDGKLIKVSKNHLMAVYTKNGIETKEAKDIVINDILLTMRSSDDCLNKTIQKIGKYKIDKEMAYLLGFFIADGNFLYDSRKQFSSYQKERGLQFTFHSKDFSLIKKINKIIKKKFNYDLKYKQDPRYENSLAAYFRVKRENKLAYFWNVETARELAEGGLKKIGGAPETIFNSSKEIIKEFLDGFFKGDGYEKGQEIHIRDKELAEDLVVLYSLIGVPVTINYRSKSQVIRIQHIKGRNSKKGIIVNDILYNRVPWFLAKKDQGFSFKKDDLICLSSLEKHGFYTEESKKILKSDLALIKIRSVKIIKSEKDQVFYDIEIAKNHYFVHSLGTISHNCCRLRLDNRELYKRGGGLFGANPLTGSIGVVTINMAKIGFVSKAHSTGSGLPIEQASQARKQFFDQLSYLMDLARESLEIKRKTIEEFTEQGLYPYCKFYLGDIKKHFGFYWRNHFSTIGLIGMNEACLNFLKKDITSKEGKKFALEVLDFMRQRLVDYQKETGHLYNLESSPAEGASYRMARIDKEKFPKIATAGKDEPYYTNSTQLPVDFTDDLFEALDLQDELQCKYTGGCVFHAFLGEKVSSGKIVKKLIKKVFEKYHLPYITITPTFSICQEHGYLKGEHFKCSHCNKEAEVYSRVVGFLRPVQQWNKGKQEEFRERKEFKIRNQ